jgi:hypothetical protein
MGFLQRGRTEDTNYNPSYGHHPRSSGIEAIAKEAASEQCKTWLELQEQYLVNSRSYARYYTLWVGSRGQLRAFDIKRLSIR